MRHLHSFGMWLKKTNGELGIRCAVYCPEDGTWTIQSAIEKKTFKGKTFNAAIVAMKDAGAR